MTRASVWLACLLASIPGLPSQEVPFRVGPFIVVAVGDSVMWGQGLAPQNKFVTKVHDWLRAKMGKEVQLTSFAHSGAITTPGTPAQEGMVTTGEVPNAFPSIPQQINVLARSVAPNLADVDLVLVDGCINDVGVTTILNPVNPTTLITNRTQRFCGGMSTLLGQIHTMFPRARIVVTGYFPIVSQGSDLTAVSELLTHVVAVSAATAEFFGIPVDPISAVISGAATAQILKDSLVDRSEAFFTESNRQLAMATDSFNASAGNFATFVPIPYGEQNAYGARDSWLWLVPTPGGERDEVFDARATACNDDSTLITAGATSSLIAVDLAKCVEASMGHPNVKGAQAYADAITKQLDAFVPQWQMEHAPVRRAP